MLTMNFLWWFFLAFVGFETLLLVWFSLNIVFFGLSRLPGLFGFGSHTPEPAETWTQTHHDAHSGSEEHTPVDLKDGSSELSVFRSSGNEHANQNLDPNSFSSIKVMADMYPSYVSPQRERSDPPVPSTNPRSATVNPKSVYNIYPTIKLAHIRRQTVRDLRRKQYQIREQKLALDSAQLREQQLHTSVDKLLHDYGSLKASLDRLELVSLNQANTPESLPTVGEARNNSNGNSDVRDGDAEDTGSDYRGFRDEAERLKQELQQMKDERDWYGKELASAKTNVEKLKTKLQDQEKQEHDGDRLEQERRRFQAENDSTAKKVEQLEQELKAARSGLGQTSEFQQGNAKLKRDFLLLQIEIENLRKAKETERNNWTNDDPTIAELKNKLQEEQKANTENAQRVQDIQRDVENRDEALRKIAQASEKYKTDIQTAHNTETTLRKEAKESAQAVSTLKHEAEETRKTLLALEQKAKERETTISGLQDDVAKGVFARKALEDKLSQSAPAAQQRHEQEVDSLKAALTKSNEALKEAQETGSARQERLNFYERVDSDLKKQLSDQRKRIAEIHASSDKKLQDLENDRNICFKEAELARGEARKKDESIAELEQQIQSLLSEAGTDDLHAKLHEKDAHVSELENALGSAQNAFAAQAQHHAQTTLPLHDTIKDAEIKCRTLEAYITTLEERIQKSVQNELVHSQVEDELRKAQEGLKNTQEQLADEQDTLKEYISVNESLVSDIFSRNEELKRQRHKNESQSNELADRDQRFNNLEAEVQRLGEFEGKNKFLEGEVSHFKRRVETYEANREEELDFARHEVRCELEDLEKKLTHEIGELKGRHTDKDVALVKAGKDLDEVKKLLDACQQQHQILTQENEQFKARPQRLATDDNTQRQYEARIKAAEDRLQQERLNRGRAEERERQERESREKAQQELARTKTLTAAQQSVFLPGVRSGPAKGYVPKVTLDTVNKRHEAEIRSRDEEIKTAGEEKESLKEQLQRETYRADSAQEAMSGQIRDLRSLLSQAQQQTPVQEVPPTLSKRTNEEVYTNPTPEQPQAPTARTPAAIRRRTRPDPISATEPRSSVFSFSPAPDAPSDLVLPPAQTSDREQGRDRTSKQPRTDEVDDEVSRPKPPTEEEKKRAAEAKRKEEMMRQIEENEKRDARNGRGDGNAGGGARPPLPPGLKPASDW